MWDWALCWPWDSVPVSSAARAGRLSSPSPLVEGRDDLLLHALQGLDITCRDGAEPDLVDTRIDELADSI